MPPPKAVFFDFDETLAENVIPVPKLFASVYDDFAARLGAENKEPFFAALRVNATELWQTMFEKSLPPEEQFQQCFQASILSASPVDQAEAASISAGMSERFLSLSSSNVRLHDGALETLQLLRREGFITGIITNGMERVQLGKIHGLELHQQVDHVVVSAHARAHKPDKRVFDLALGLAGVDASEAWQVGDHATNDVAGAIRAGMSGVFYDPGQDRLEHAFNELEESPTHVVNHLSEVAQLAMGSGPL